MICGILSRTSLLTTPVYTGDPFPSRLATDRTPPRRSTFLGDRAPFARRFGVGVVAGVAPYQPSPLSNEAHDSDPGDANAVQDEPSVLDFNALADQHLFGPQAGTVFPVRFRVPIDAEVVVPVPEGQREVHAGTLKQETSRYISVSSTAPTGRATE